MVCDKIFYYIKENNLNVLLSKKQKQFYESFNLNIGCCEMNPLKTRRLWYRRVTVKIHLNSILGGSSIFAIVTPFKGTHFCKTAL